MIFFNILIIDIMSENFVTPKEYYSIARKALSGHRQPLVAYDSSTNTYLMGGRSFKPGDDAFYKSYIQILHNNMGVPNFEIDMNLKIVDEKKKDSERKLPQPSLPSPTKSGS